MFFKEHAFRILVILRLEPLALIIFCIERIFHLAIGLTFKGNSLSITFAQFTLNEQFHKSMLFAAGILGFDLWHSFVVITLFGHGHVHACMCVECVCVNGCVSVWVGVGGNARCLLFTYFSHFLSAKAYLFISRDYTNNHTMTPLVTKMFSVITVFFPLSSWWRVVRKPPNYELFRGIFTFSQNPIFVKFRQFM